MIKIETKYNIEDKIYWNEMFSIPSKHKCPLCLGEGILLRHDESSIKCPKCEGKKEIESGGTIKYKVHSGIIRSVKIFVENPSYPDIYYILKPDEDNRHRELQEYELFYDILAASNECDKKNKGSVMGYTK